jgi:hypothetical protein
MRAGSDIGYCDSDHPKAPFEWCEQDIKTNVEALGFMLEEVILGDYKMRLYLIDKDTNVAYDYEDLYYDTYETFTRRDFLKEYDNRFSPCCGADIIEDYGRCKQCKEAII